MHPELLCNNSLDRRNIVTPCIAMGAMIPHHGPVLWTANDGAPCIPPIKTCLSHNPPTLQDFNPGVPFTLCSTHATSLSTFGEYLVSQFDV